jgi:hypothetical protein
MAGTVTWPPIGEGPTELKRLILILFNVTGRLFFTEIVIVPEKKTAF